MNDETLSEKKTIQLTLTEGFIPLAVAAFLWKAVFSWCETTEKEPRETGTVPVTSTFLHVQDRERIIDLE